MVNVSHDGDNRCAWQEIVFIVLLLGDGFRHLCTYIFGLEIKFLSHKVDGFGIQTLVD